MTKKSVFIIGDSISCYYGKHLKKMLEDIFDYDRKGDRHILKDLDDGTNGINGGDSCMVFKYLKAMKDKDNFNPDYLLLNCGIHDIKKDLISGKHQVPINDYEKNLRKIYSLLQEMGINIIWIRTTPVNEKHSVGDETKAACHNQDVISYNRIADKVMKEYHIPVINLYTFTKNLGDDIYLDRVHFNEEGAGKQAAFIAGYLNAISKSETF